jgi:hypothetical protein
MPLDDKQQENMFSESSGNADSITAERLAHIKAKFDSNDYLLDNNSFETLAPILYQLQQVSKELDELRRYLTAEVGTMTSLSGSSLPTRVPARGLLWNDRGTVKIG